LNWKIQVLPSKPLVKAAPRLGRRLPVQWYPDRTALFSLVFSRPMDPDGVAAALQVDPPLRLDLRWEGETLLLQTLDPLVPGKSYRFTISESATASDGVPLAREISWEHKVKVLLARADYPTLQDPAAPLTLRFNYPLDPASLWESLRLEPSLEGECSSGWARLSTSPRSVRSPGIDGGATSWEASAWG